MPIGKKYGGRKKGTPNKKTEEAQALADRLGVDPLAILLMIAKGDWKGLGYEKPTETKYTQFGNPYEVPLFPLPLKTHAAESAVQYIRPKRKAIEHSGLDGGPIEAEIVLETSWREAPKDES